ncbi:MAG TPA: plastocyanin/azurin family copper-binding protein [Gammaproteobacteria bacterium]|nr:plastocyanin/azurin family copper-binding protein [Gammaproteobacteria bacterium]
MLRKSLIYLLFALLSMTAFATQARTVKIIAQDSLRFSVDEIIAKPGETLTIKLVNNTKLPAMAMSHNFVLLKNSADPHAFDQAASQAKDTDYIPKSKADEIIAHTGLVSGGESDTVTFKAPTEPGTYLYICTFPGHFPAGMKGSLVVKAQ